MGTKTFAASTTVSAEKTRVEFERLVKRYGAVRFASGWQTENAAVMFEMHGRRIRFLLPMPDVDDERFTRSGRGKRSAGDQRRVYEQTIRTSWRALYLVIKAKLEAVESGISIFDSEFLAQIVVPGKNDQTVGDWALPLIADAYERGTKLPPLLPGAV